MTVCKPELLPFHDPVVKATSRVRHGDNKCLWITVVCWGITSLLIISFLIVYTHLVLKGVDERTSKLLKDELWKLRKELISTLSTQNDNEEDNKGQETSTEISRIVNRYKRQSGTNVSPFIHLVGIDKNRVTEADVIYFVWNNVPKSPGSHGFELIGDPVKGYNKIVVKHSGVYLVYAQVAVHGRDNVNQPNECSHQTVCDRENKDRIVLLSSLVTQYQLGGPYQDNVHKQWLRAVDTKVHLGVFMLMKNDVLSVQIPPNCGNMEYSPSYIHSYFGVAQISKIGKFKPPPQQGNGKDGKGNGKDGKKGKKKGVI
uniref:THD domain-containing protein n=1 Tax=Arion vulgaris TaxID=1028688 RepID=A0A0B7A3P5_9EUPU